MVKENKIMMIFWHRRFWTVGNPKAAMTFAFRRALGLTDERRGETFPHDLEICFPHDIAVRRIGLLHILNSHHNI